MFNDLLRLASTLDEHIEKGMKLEPKSRIEQLTKSLSHDPFRPHDMTFDSPYYNPYKFQPGEGYMPHTAQHWASQGKKAEDYLTTTMMYDDFKRLTTKYSHTDKCLKSLFKLGEDLVKAAAQPAAKPKAAPAAKAPGSPTSNKVPVGTIHVYKDGERYQKVDAGVWVPVGAPENKAHMKYLNHHDQTVRSGAHQQIESHAEEHGARLQKLKDIIDQRGAHEDTKRQTTHQVLSELGHPAAEKYSDEAHVKGTLDKHSKEAAKTSAKNHHVDVNFNFKGKTHSYQFKNVEGANKHEAQKKVEEGMAQIQALRGHKITKISAKEYERLPEEGIYTPKESLGIKRKDMPQIAEADHEKFLKYLEKKGVRHTKGKIKVSELKPSQSEMDASAAKRLVGSEKADSPIIVSSDNYVVDGHHRWLANRMKNETSKVNTIKINMPAKDLINVMKEAPQSFARDINNDQPTAQKYKNEKGEYKQERKELHDKILNKALEGVHSVPPPEGQKPVLILTGGGSGSGKSAVMRKAKEQMKEDLVHVDSDQIKNELPEYKEMLKAGNDKAAALAHDESSELASEMVNKAMSESKPILLDSTLKNVEKFKKLISKAKAAGYEVHIAFADVPVEVAKERAAKRAERSGRKVPDNIIEDSHKGAIQSLGQLIDDVDTATVYSTMNEPKEVYKKDNRVGITNKDESYLSEMQKRGHILKSEKTAQVESDVMKKFAKILAGVGAEYDSDDNESEDPDFESQLKYEGESNERQGK